MIGKLTAEDALAALSRSSLPTVITEGSDDYRIMRKIESRLSDIGVDFLPLGGKKTVLEVWRRLPDARRHSVVTIVDLDLWILQGVPAEYQGEDIIYTFGFSIENDIFIDANLINLCDDEEKERFFNELSLVSSWYSGEIQKALRDDPYEIKVHAAEVINRGGLPINLDDDGNQLDNIIQLNYAQVVRGKTLIELLARQLNRHGRFAKFGYKQIYEIGSYSLGEILSELERKIRIRLS